MFKSLQNVIEMCQKGRSFDPFVQCEQYIWVEWTGQYTIR